LQDGVVLEGPAAERLEGLARELARLLVVLDLRLLKVPKAHSMPRV
jgi:hypothetical protein